MRSDGGAAGDVFVEGERIVSAAPARSSTSTLDATGCHVLPGFIDLQCNGAFGVDFTTSPEGAHVVAAQLPATGVTSFLPTVISAPRRGAAGRGRSSTCCAVSSPGARSLGVHLEGPFINPAAAAPILDVTSVAGSRRGGDLERRRRRGARDPRARAGRRRRPHRRPGRSRRCRLLRSLRVVGGRARRGVAAGVTGATHLFNAMGSLSARSPGTAGAVLANGAVLSGIIVDGVHVDPAMVAIAWRALGDGRLFFVTDAIAALGLPGGLFRVGETDVIVDETGVHTAKVCWPAACCEWTRRCGTSWRSPVARSPKQLPRHRPHRPECSAGDVGVIEPGALADVVLLDSTNHVVATVVGGRVVFDPQRQRLELSGRLVEVVIQASPAEVASCRRRRRRSTAAAEAERRCSGGDRELAAPHLHRAHRDGIAPAASRSPRPWPSSSTSTSACRDGHPSRTVPSSPVSSRARSTSLHAAVQSPDGAAR